MYVLCTLDDFQKHEAQSSALELFCCLIQPVVIYIYIYIYYIYYIYEQNNSWNLPNLKREIFFRSTPYENQHKVKWKVKFVQTQFYPPVHPFPSTSKHLRNIRLHMVFTLFSNSLVFSTNQNITVLRAQTCLKTRYSLTEYRNVLISSIFNLEKYFKVVFLSFHLFIKNMSCVNLSIIALENCSEI